MSNIILNPDFSQGMRHWYFNSCDGFVRSSSSSSHVVVTNRTQSWQGLEQDITSRVQPGYNYLVSALVGVLRGSAYVEASLRLDYPDSTARYQYIGRTVVSERDSAKLEGEFMLRGMPQRVVFYLHGPSGVDIIIDSAKITSEKEMSNIILNPDFSQGMRHWYFNSCDGFVRSSSSSSHVVVTNRTQSWQGLEQDITSRVQPGYNYLVSALVGVLRGSAYVEASLRLDYPDSTTRYQSIGSTVVSERDSSKLEGQFMVRGMPQRGVFYLHGPPGVDIIINSAKITSESTSTGKNIAAAAAVTTIAYGGGFVTGHNINLDKKKTHPYQVFLSFYGKDTRDTFTDDLYNALCEKKIHTFKDDDKRGKGGVIGQVLWDAIEVSKISIIVFSQNFARSKWCLNEVVKIIECGETMGKVVIPVFYYVNPNDVGNQEGSYGELPADHIEDNEYVINRWKTALTEASTRMGFHLQQEYGAEKYKKRYEREWIEKICEAAKHHLN